MKNYLIRKELLFLITIFFIISCKETPKTEPVPWYLSLNNSSLQVSQPYALGTISSNSIEYGGNISEEHKEVYFTINDSNWSSSYAAVSTFTNNTLNTRDTVKFGGKTMQGGDAHLSPDGNKLYIASRFSTDTSKTDGNIWMANREINGWSEATKLPKSINTELGEYSPSQTKSGSIYFTRFSEESHGDIYVSEFKNGIYQEAVKLPNTVNSKFIECDSWVAPDESFILFVRHSKDGFKNCFGHFDLFISFNIDGVWTEAKNLGEQYNSQFVEGSPSLSPDFKHIFYTSNRRSSNPNAFDGFIDIYIQEFDLEKLKSELLKT